MPWANSGLPRTESARRAVEAVWWIESARIVGALARYTGAFAARRGRRAGGWAHTRGLPDPERDGARRVGDALDFLAGLTPILAQRVRPRFDLATGVATRTRSGGCGCPTRGLGSGRAGRLGAGRVSRCVG